MANLPVSLAMAPKFYTERILENLDYESNDSTSQCLQLIADCNALLILRPQRAQSGGPSGEQLQFDANAVVAVRDGAEKWLKSQTAKTYHESQNIGYINTEYIAE